MGRCHCSLLTVQRTTRKPALFFKPSFEKKEGIAHMSSSSPADPPPITVNVNEPSQADPNRVPTTKIVEFIARILLFIAYFVLSFVLILNWNSAKCLVQHTYRQEFLTSVASNPFFSSINVLRDAPLSKLERVAYGSANYTQNFSSIAMFPVQIFNAADKAAFLTVYPEPGGLIAPADDPILMPAYVIHSSTMLFSPHILRRDR